MISKAVRRGRPETKHPIRAILVVCCARTMRGAARRLGRQQPTLAGTALNDLVRSRQHRRWDLEATALAVSVPFDLEHA